MNNEDNDINAVIACLGDDAATLRENNPECEIAANMDRAVKLLQPLANLSAIMREQRAPSSGGKHITVMYPDGFSASGLGPLPADSPAEPKRGMMTHDEWHDMRVHLLFTLDSDERHRAIAFSECVPRIVDYISHVLDRETLRDSFAARALQATYGTGERITAADYAEDAYKMADAMLAERAK